MRTSLHRLLPLAPFLCFLLSSCAAEQKNDGLKVPPLADVLPDHVEELPSNAGADAGEDGGCMPDCTEKECGNDGCGGSCGTCPAAAPVCEDGICKVECVPDCQGRECGDDGCGGACGACPEATPLCQGGICMPECIPDCSGKECGGDGCGGECGQCEQDEACVEWACKCLNKTCGGTCCEKDEVCCQGECCLPDCEGKECGTDECGGSCAECGVHFTCEDGQCIYQPYCGDGLCDLETDETCESCPGDCGCDCGEQCIQGACVYVACDGKECGNSGCSGSCGDCDADHVCVDGICEEYCVPECLFADGTPKECGPNGCGSICGYCPYGYQCDDGLCEAYCVPLCEGKQCGFDGCYGECPPGCEEGFVCGEDQLCYPFCDPDENCEGKECGPDGCGGTCGECGPGAICDEGTGLCVPNECGDVPEDQGKCVDGNVLLECVDGVIVETDCQDIDESYYCQWLPVLQKFTCVEGCVPQCTWEDGTPKECGYDGCFGTCGACPVGWTCVAGECYPEQEAECAWITEIGTCLWNELWYCIGGELSVEDCEGMGLACQFDGTAGKYKCQ